MSENLKLTMALEHYDRHIPLFDGSVKVEGVELKVLEVGQSVTRRDGTARHERMLRLEEFDGAEVSFSSYLMARDRGMPFIALPVFPRRLFSMSQMYCNVGAGLYSPRNLAGRRVGLGTYQTTLSVLAKGDLAHHYDVNWKDIHWITSRPETVPFALPPGVHMEQAPHGSNLGQMLAEGKIDALIVPHPPQSVLDGDRRVTRLFPDARTEEIRYFQVHSFYPVMHVIALRAKVLERNPGLAGALLEAFEQAGKVSKAYYDDPNWSRLAWGSHYLAEETRVLQADPWVNGLEPNRKNLEYFIRCSCEQGLISRPMEPEELFA